MSFDEKKLVRIIESALFAAGRPLNIEQLGKLFVDEERPSNPEIKQALATLFVDYKDRGVVLVEVSSGWRFQSRQEFAPWIQKLWEERPARYSRASLETLSLIAYRQPVTRAEIEDIRGVSVSSSIMKSLLEREWVRVVGHRDVPGRPALYATTRIFLDYFNLKSLEQLPTLSEIKDLETLNPQLDLTDKPPKEHLSVDTTIKNENKKDASFTAEVLQTTQSEVKAQNAPLTDNHKITNNEESTDQDNVKLSIASDQVH